MTFFEFLDKNKIIKGLLIAILVMFILHIGYYMYKGYTLTSEYVSLKPPIGNTKIADTTSTKIDTNKLPKKTEVITPKIKYVYLPSKITERNKDTAIGVDQKPTSQVSVTSYGQTGGITANEVNIGKPNKVRSLTISDKEYLLNFLPEKNEKIKILFLVNDNEGYQYAKQFYDFLLSHNYTNVNNFITPFMTNKPLYGQYVYRNEMKEVEIKIGTVEE